jgi:hypothetical protein
MNTLWIVVIAVVVIYVVYNFYAKMIDRDVIQVDAKKATPAKMYHRSQSMGLVARAAVADDWSFIHRLGERLQRHRRGGAE